jgi:hypothetical protein
MKNRRFGPVLLALLPLACGRSGPLTLDDTSPEQAVIAEIRLCGFPESQLVEEPSGRGYFGVLRVGQRVPLELKGRTDLVQSVSWWAGDWESPRSPFVHLAQTGPFSVVLVADAAGGDDPGYPVHVSAAVEFKDDSGRTRFPSACRGDDFDSAVAAERIVVVP